ncbi:ribosomal protein S18-alanine N-acetyltransferase [Shewanella sp. 202IG2-18]|uniref:ribosomal protein S18-alanine N-acetyltransferase n=1 Tax=Parashewanella hymeniacidonis TaxID=2807618 RepID=UPI00195F5616|nr:ribosomal protein S18-alanine N-acetyltransferase [Parashewanella hymeniacidonis]MBM7070521.1 ribosomal protein S18-alanine N-acetyltransferase [Parashewanella hymeniacidonis]
MKTEKNALRFVELSKDDSQLISTIEKLAHSHPMSEANIQSCFGHLYHNLGLKLNEQLVAFAIVHQVVDEATLMDICVSPYAQGQGLGKILMAELIQTAKKREASFLQLEVRASNQSAIQLYIKSGFTETGKRKEYYPSKRGREDAILMELKL